MRYTTRYTEDTMSEAEQKAYQAALWAAAAEVQKLGGGTPLLGASPADQYLIAGFRSGIAYAVAAIREMKPPAEPESKAA
jgi:hypothetical protein